MRRLGGAMAVVLVCCGAISGVRAQEPEDAARDQEARSLFEAGRTALGAGRARDALRDFERSYELSHRSALLYNVGVAAAAAQQTDRAIEAFESFLAAEPDTDRRSEVEGRLRTLREARAGQAAEPGLPATGDGGAAGPGAAPWILVGGGGAVAVAGTVLFVLGLGANSDVESVEMGTPWPSVAGDYDRGTLFTTLGLVLGPTGLAAVGVGLVWALTGGGREDEPGAAALRRARGEIGVRAGLGTFSLEVAF